MKTINALTFKNITKKICLPTLILLALPLTSFANEQWKITTSMESSSMNMSMPGMERTVCVADGQYNKPSEKMVPAKDGCKVSNFRINGSTASFHLECAAPHKMSGDGSFTHKGSDAYSGDMKMKGDFGQGGNGDMHMHFDGQKLGSCTAQQTPDYAAAAGAQMSAACTQGINEMQPAIFMIPACQSMKPKFCARVKNLLGNAQDPNKLSSVIKQRPDWANLADACDMDSLSIQTAACDKAKTTKNWAAVPVVCPPGDAEAIASDHCVRRAYTGSNSSNGEYSALCDAFPDLGKTPPGGAGAGAASGVMDMGNKAMDGLNKLKGLFGR
jgi:hypothetical protein